MPRDAVSRTVHVERTKKLGDCTPTEIYQKHPMMLFCKHYIVVTGERSERSSYYAIIMSKHNIMLCKPYAVYCYLHAFIIIYFIYCYHLFIVNIYLFLSFIFSYVIYYYHLFIVIYMHLNTAGIYPTRSPRKEMTPTQLSPTQLSPV